MEYEEVAISKFSFRKIYRGSVGVPYLLSARIVGGIPVALLPFY